MRRLGAIAVCAAALFFAGGCGGDSTPSTAGTSAAPPATSAAATASPTGSSDKEVCDQIKAINAQYTGQITTTFQKMADQLAKGDQAGAATTLNELTTLTKEWSTKIEPLIARTNNPQLKEALNNLLTGVKKLESGNGSMSDLQKLAADANAALDRYCS
jgi:hypothetical protein